MAYEVKSWADRQSEYPVRRRLTPVAGMNNVYEVSREEGLISEEGSAFDGVNMNGLEGRVAAAFGELTVGTVKAGRAVQADGVDWAGVTGKPAAYPAAAHNHDGSYYTEAEVNSLLAGKAAASHAHGAGALTAGALAAGVVAANAEDYAASRLRNASFATAKPASLANGTVCFIYE